MIGEKQLKKILHSLFLRIIIMICRIYLTNHIDLNVKDIDCLNLPGELGHHLYSVHIHSPHPPEASEPQPTPVIS